MHKFAFRGNWQMTSVCTMFQNQHWWRQKIKNSKNTQNSRQLVEFESIVKLPYSASALAPAPHQKTMTSCHSGSSGLPWQQSFQRMEPQEKCTGNLFITWTGDQRVTETQNLKIKQLKWNNKAHRSSAVLDITGRHIPQWSHQSRVQLCWEGALLSPDTHKVY